MESDYKFKIVKGELTRIRWRKRDGDLLTTWSTNCEDYSVYRIQTI